MRGRTQRSCPHIKISAGRLAADAHSCSSAERRDDWKMIGGCRGVDDAPLARAHVLYENPVDRMPFAERCRPAPGAFAQSVNECRSGQRAERARVEQWAVIEIAGHEYRPIAGH